ncbi:uncharacterized protein P884DRAFT_280889 [Thermothelomyces heterothallicus CBS 202.75]|uniref:uncharacterized protein n=1 Tax=Thermothelomyces heterothallicus CBS 202.75 TaxID=1149848 RepID=UPI003744A23E
MARKRLVLVTGINGYIAAHTAAALLKAGYAVRGTVRARTANVENLVRKLNEYHDGDRLELVEIPDISADGAFDRAVEGVQAIAHIASPVSTTETDPAPMMRAAVRGTTSLLSPALVEARKRSGKDALKSAVFMSSMSAVFSPNRPAGHVFTENDWNDVAEEELRRLGTSAPGYTFYQASKTAAERAFWEYGKEIGAEFAMTGLCPAPVFGPPLYLPEPISSLSIRIKEVYDIFQGGPIPEFSPIRSTFIDVRDVAELVLRAFEQHGEQPGARNRYVLTAQPPISPQQIADVLRESFPERRGKIGEGNPGERYPHMTWKFDSSKAASLLGREWIGFRQSVVDSAKAFLGAKSV